VSSTRQDVVGLQLVLAYYMLSNKYTTHRNNGALTYITYVPVGEVHANESVRQSISSLTEKTQTLREHLGRQTNLRFTLSNTYEQSVLY